MHCAAGIGATSPVFCSLRTWSSATSALEAFIPYFPHAHASGPLERSLTLFPKPASPFPQPVLPHRAVASERTAHRGADPADGQLAPGTPAFVKKHAGAACCSRMAWHGGPPHRRHAKSSPPSLAGAGRARPRRRQNWGLPAPRHCHKNVAPPPLPALPDTLLPQPKSTGAQNAIWPLVAGAQPALCPSCCTQRRCRGCAFCRCG